MRCPRFQSSAIAALQGASETNEGVLVEAYVFPEPSLRQEVERGVLKRI